VNDPVDAHVETYNERDLDRFVGCFSPDCVTEDARGVLVARGHAALRGRDGGEQYGVVVSHISGGVIDHQRFIR
jgi:hypothetical protein